MFAICLEASHAKGMGHLFRMLNFFKYLKEKKEKVLFLINDNEITKDILRSNAVNYEVVDLDDLDSNWEKELIDKYKISYWINDRLNTDERHVLNVKSKNVQLITFDDLGSGAKFCNFNICGLFFNQENLRGKKVLKGVKYLILNNEIDAYKRERNQIDNILITLGGSDTYGVTVKILKILKRYDIKATIHIGPSFKHNEELKNELNDNYVVINYIPSLIEEFSKYDLAITGGGITPFEANASGLPCLIVANEKFEIANGEFLNTLHSSVFLGYHENINENIIKNIKKLEINKMSEMGMNNIYTDAVSKIYKEVKLV